MITINFPYMFGNIYWPPSAVFHVNKGVTESEATRFLQ